MNARFLHPSAAGSTASPTAPGGMTARVVADTEGSVGRACCCPARPAVRVIMPPSPSRPHTTELLLCGHHYRVSRTVLAAARAVVRELPGTPENIVSWAGIEQADPVGRLS